ncbi:endonuclease/exonuclease/phosphatase family protein [Longispora albida]|uniref:endonuclease/exonuclease/phosphatase family protein n=1 Tax=Longispora albida TaxID=203523 RepID=UPI00037E008D|nr:endonuclease/exonuclease/phosphatase family protein [Longispora albida]
MPETFTFATYNLYNYLRQHPREHPDETARYDAVAAVIRDLDADIVAVQEVCHPAGLEILAKATGMTGVYQPAWADEDDAEADRWAFTPGQHGFGLGLLWRTCDWIVPDPRSFRVYGPGEMWHGLAALTLTIRGERISVASYHAPPFGQNRREDEAERLVAILTRALGGAALLGGDMNTTPATRAPGGAGWYDPDPYQGVEWYSDMIYQCDWTPTPDGQRAGTANRRAADILLGGGLHDTAALAEAPWAPTTGHHPDDDYAQRGLWRRIDLIHATDALTGRVTGHRVRDNQAAREASDHLPVTVTIT